MSLTYNTRPRDENGQFLPARNEGEFRGFRFVGNGDKGDGNVYQWGFGDETTGYQHVVTVRWTGLRSGEGDPIFQAVDDLTTGPYRYCPKGAWFGQIDENLKLVGPDGQEL